MRFFARRVKDDPSFLPTYLGGDFFPLLGVSERNVFSGGGGGGRCTFSLRSLLFQLGCRSGVKTM